MVNIQTKFLILFFFIYLLTSANCMNLLKSAISSIGADVSTLHSFKINNGILIDTHCWKKAIYINNTFIDCKGMKNKDLIAREKEKIK